MSATRRILNARLNIEADGTVSSLDFLTQIEMANPDNDTMNPTMMDKVHVGLADFTPAEETALNNVATALAAMLERKRPMVKP